MEKKTDDVLVEPDKSRKYYSHTAYCDNCKREVEYLIHKTRRYGTWRGVRYRYKGKKANCRVCGSTITLPEVLEYNMRMLEAESKKEKHKEQEQQNDDWRIARNCIYPARERMY